MITKKRLFIGSSTEALSLAEEAKSILEEYFDVTIWNDNIWDTAVFRINQNFLSDLMKATLKFDYGILLGTKDDVVQYKGKKFLTPRDNVLFELGLFTGRLGIAKCAFVIEKELKVLSDLQGISMARFDRYKPDEFKNAIIQVKEVFLKSLDGDINFFPSATLAAGYFENLVAPTCHYVIKNSGFSFEDIHYEKVKLKIIIPSRITRNVNMTFEKLKKNFATKTVFFEYDGRPRSIFLDTKIVGDTLEFVDFPTTISGINYAILNLLPDDFNQLSDDYNLIVDRELKRFVGTLKQLLLRDGLDDMVDFIYEEDIKNS
jgi:hypothetical protein